jgi:hypothetical protein
MITLAPWASSLSVSSSLAGSGQWSSIESKVSTVWNRRHRLSISARSRNPKQPNRAHPGCGLAGLPKSSFIWRLFWDCPFELCASALSNHQLTLQKEHKLAKPNYQFEKRKREIEKKAKKEEKKLRKLQPDDPSPPKVEPK